LHIAPERPQAAAQEAGRTRQPPRWGILSTPESLAVPVESEKIGSWPGWRQPCPAAAAVLPPASTEPDVQDEPDGALVPPARVAPLLRPLRRALGALGVGPGPGGHGGGR